MKKLLLSLMFLSFVTVSKAENSTDSLIIYPKPGRHTIYVSKKGEDSSKFNMFLYTQTGHLMRRSNKYNELYVNDIPNGQYVLELYDEKKLYRLFIDIDN
jgi:hypothetical protein